jgi:hypothetical protein
VTVAPRIEFHPPFSGTKEFVTGARLNTNFQLTTWKRGGAFTVSDQLTVTSDSSQPYAARGSLMVTADFPRLVYTAPYGFTEVHFTNDTAVPTPPSGAVPAASRSCQQAAFVTYQAGYGPSVLLPLNDWVQTQVLLPGAYDAQDTNTCVIDAYRSSIASSVQTWRTVEKLAVTFNTAFAGTPKYVWSRSTECDLTAAGCNWVSTNWIQQPNTISTQPGDMSVAPSDAKGDTRKIYATWKAPSGWDRPQIYIGNRAQAQPNGCHILAVPTQVWLIHPPSGAWPSAPGTVWYEANNAALNCDLGARSFSYVVDAAGMVHWTFQGTVTLKGAMGNDPMPIAVQMGSSNGGEPPLQWKQVGTWTR